MNGEFIAPGEWIRALRSMRFGTIRGVRAPTIRCVAATFASYAEYGDGTRVYPGIALLAIHSEVDYRTARTVVAILRDLGLVEMVRGGRRRGAADEYRLSMPNDITDRLKVLSPAEIDLEVERIRAANRSQPRESVRGSATPVRDGDGESVRVSDGPVPASEPTSVRASAQPVRDTVQDAVRVPAEPVPVGRAECRAGVSDTANGSCTGVTDGPYGCRCAPPPKHPHRDSKPTDTTLNDLRTELTVPGTRGSDDETHIAVDGVNHDPAPSHGPSMTAAAAQAAIRATLARRTRPTQNPELTPLWHEPKPQPAGRATATSRTAPTQSDPRATAPSAHRNAKSPTTGRSQPQRPLWPSSAPETSPPAQSALPPSTAASTPAAVGDWTETRVEVA